MKEYIKQLEDTINQITAWDTFDDGYLAGLKMALSLAKDNHAS